MPSRLELGDGDSIAVSGRPLIDRPPVTHEKPASTHCAPKGPYPWTVSPRSNGRRRRSGGLGERKAVCSPACRQPPTGRLILARVRPLIVEAGVERSVDVRYLDAQLGDVRDAGADIAAARRDLGFSPGVSLSDGLNAQLQGALARVGA